MSSPTPDRYAVIGNPIAHSRSPSIHARFALATGEAVAYDRLLAPLDGFAAAVHAFRGAGGRGLNVTVPFKREAFDYAGELTPRARAAGAVNTLAFDGARALGDNTDGVGLLRDVERLGVSPAGASVLVVGAGGAARGALAALAVAGCARLAVANRTAERAEALVREAALRGTEAIALDALAGERFDLVVNATSGGLHGEPPAVPAALLARARLAYDMVYGVRPPPFVILACQAGCPLVADGLGMLVEQAAESFRLWRGVLPDTAPVLAALRAELAAEGS